MDSGSPSKHLSEKELRLAIYHALLARSDNGVLKKGSITAVADQFSCSPKTLPRIWKPI